jgi:glutamate carboxypeptidase
MWPLIERSSRIADLYEYTKRVGAELRIDLAEASVGGASDGSFCAGVNRSVLDGPGLVGDGGDALTEHTWWVSDMAPRATFVARMLEWVPISEAGNGEPF